MFVETWVKHALHFLPILLNCEYW